MDEPTPFDEDDDWTNKDLISRYYRYGIQPDWLAIHRILNHRYVSNCNAAFVIVITFLFTKLSCLDQDTTKDTFRSSNQAVTCAPQTVEASHSPFFIAERQAGKL